MSLTQPHPSYVQGADRRGLIYRGTLPTTTVTTTTMANKSTLFVKFPSVTYLKDIVFSNRGASTTLKIFIIPSAIDPATGAPTDVMETPNTTTQLFGTVTIPATSVSSLGVIDPDYLNLAFPAASEIHLEGSLATCSMALTFTAER